MVGLRRLLCPRGVLRFHCGAGKELLCLRSVERGWAAAGLLLQTPTCCDRGGRVPGSGPTCALRVAGVSPAGLGSNFGLVVLQ